eukprot:SAG11_NODE_6310_length_1340_cov_1.891217_1_plen_173_part_00
MRLKALKREADGVLRRRAMVAARLEKSEHVLWHYATNYPESRAAAELHEAERMKAAAVHDELLQLDSELELIESQRASISAALANSIQHIGAARSSAYRADAASLVGRSDSYGGLATAAEVARQKYIWAPGNGYAGLQPRRATSLVTPSSTAASAARRQRRMRVLGMDHPAI